MSPACRGFRCAPKVGDHGSGLSQTSAQGFKITGEKGNGIFWDGMLRPWKSHLSYQLRNSLFGESAHPRAKNIMNIKYL